MGSNTPLGIAFFGAGDVSDLHAEGVRRCRDARLIGLSYSAAVPMPRLKTC